MENLATANL